MTQWWDHQTHPEAIRDAGFHSRQRDWHRQEMHGPQPTASRNALLLASSSSQAGQTNTGVGWTEAAAGLEQLWEFGYQCVYSMAKSSHTGWEEVQILSTMGFPSLLSKFMKSASPRPLALGEQSWLELDHVTLEKGVGALTIPHIRWFRERKGHGKVKRNRAAILMHCIWHSGFCTEQWSTGWSNTWALLAWPSHCC